MPLVLSVPPLTREGPVAFVLKFISCVSVCTHREMISNVFVLFPGLEKFELTLK